MKKKNFWVGCIIVLSMIVSSNLKAQSSVNEKESARVFVQKFYDWYVVLFSAPPEKWRTHATSIIAITQKSSSFDTALRKALLDDDHAQSKNTDDIVGLDFDPFLMAQDIGFDYQTGNVKQVGDKFFVDIHSALKGKSKKAILAKNIVVVAEVVKAGTSWKFTNFIYPAEGKQKQSDLLEILASLRKDRENPNSK